MCRTMDSRLEMIGHTSSIAVLFVMSRPRINGEDTMAQAAKCVRASVKVSGWGLRIVVPLEWVCGFHPTCTCVVTPTWSTAKGMRLR